MLAIASRGPTDRLTPDPDNPRRQHQHHPRAEPDLLTLLALGGGIPERLQATVAAVWERRLRSGHRALDQTRPRLQAALYGRVLSAVRTWLDSPRLEIELDMVDRAAPRALRRCDDAETIAVTLPFAWLTEVWAPDLALVLGRFCTAARAGADGGWTLQTLAADLTTRETVDISVRGGR